jgi:hypothetical protein
MIVIGLISMTMLRREKTAANSGGPPQFEQITNFTDSASEPALSPDGKMVGFIRGADAMGSSANEGQVWIKLLPNGDPVQLTHSAARKNAVTFSPDGSRVAYTQLNARFLWDTWGVPVFRGQTGRGCAHGHCGVGSKPGRGDRGLLAAGRNEHGAPLGSFAGW